MDFPVEVALAQLSPTLPTGPGWWYEIKLDGHRTIMWRTADGVRLQSRSGRDDECVLFLSGCPQVSGTGQWWTTRYGWLRPPIAS